MILIKYKSADGIWHYLAEIGMKVVADDFMEAVERGDVAVEEVEDK